jgi:hypothetical protein
MLDLTLAVAGCLFIFLAPLFKSRQILMVKVGFVLLIAMPIVIVASYTLGETPTVTETITRITELPGNAVKSNIPVCLSKTVTSYRYTSFRGTTKYVILDSQKCKPGE